MGITGHAPTESGQVGGEASAALTIAARFACPDKPREGGRRPVIEQVLWRGGENEDTITATDTYQLFLRKVSREEAGIRPEVGEDWFIPAVAVCKVTGTKAIRANPVLGLRSPCPVKEAATKNGTVVYEFDAEAEDSPHHIGLQCQDEKAWSKKRLAVAETVEGVYPNYERVIPDLGDPVNPVTWEGEVNAHKLLAILPHLYDVEEGCHRVEAHFDEERLTVCAHQDNGYHLEAKGEVAAEVTLYENPEVAAYNGRYLADLLSAIVTENGVAKTNGGHTPPYPTVRWCYRKPLEPLTLDGPWGLYLVMPMVTY